MVIGAKRRFRWKKVQVLLTFFAVWCEATRSSVCVRKLPGTAFSSMWPWMEYSASTEDLFLVIRRSWHFWGWKLMSHCLSHCWSASKSDCRSAASWWVWISLYMRQSSANNLVLDERTHLGRSCMYIRNNRGPRTVPWGTPDVTGLVSDDFPSRMTVCSRCDRNYAIHPRVFPVIPIASSLSNRRLWATLSNAFAKSSRMASVWVLPSSHLQRGGAAIHTSASFWSRVGHFQDVVKIQVPHDLGANNILHNFGTYRGQRHWSVVGGSGMVTLFANGDYVGFPPLLGDGGLPIGGPEYGCQDGCD